jgi:NAD(P)-dependent dehydrogenase (short-subunit alcohol dehydrogenase family)
VVRDNPEVNKRVADMTALGRVGQPDDIGPMIASLLSDDNRRINVQRIEVSGGMAIYTRLRRQHRNLQSQHCHPRRGDRE